MPIARVAEFVLAVVTSGDHLSRRKQRQVDRCLTGLLVGPPWTVRGVARQTVGATDRSNLNHIRHPQSLVREEGERAAGGG